MSSLSGINEPDIGWLLSHRCWVLRSLLAQADAVKHAGQLLSEKSSRKAERKVRRQLEEHDFNRCSECNITFGQVRREIQKWDRDLELIARNSLKGKLERR